MAKVQIKFDRITPFGGIFLVMEKFSHIMEPIIDKTLGIRCKSSGYKYGEIVRSLMSIYFCGGSCVEDVTSNLMTHLSLHPHLKTCSSDTVLRAIKELSVSNISYKSETGKVYDFNTCDKVNELLLEALLSCGQLNTKDSYDIDFDHQFLETEKYDAKRTYKKFLGYSPGVAVIGDLIVGIENRDGNANVRFHQVDTLNRIFSRVETKGLKIQRARMDCGSCSREIVETVEKHCKHLYIRANKCAAFYNDMVALRSWKAVEIENIPYELNALTIEKWPGKSYRLIVQRQKRNDGISELWEGEYTYRCILTNDYESTPLDIVLFYNKRGGKERIFDEMNNGFGWKRLPKSFMNENTVFLLLTALIRNFYKLIMNNKKIKEFGLESTSRIKAFVFKFVTIAAKWIHMSRQDILNIYTDKSAYLSIFSNTDG